MIDHYLRIEMINVEIAAWRAGVRGFAETSTACEGKSASSLNLDLFRFCSERFKESVSKPRRCSDLVTMQVGRVTVSTGADEIVCILEILCTENTFISSARRTWPQGII